MMRKCCGYDNEGNVPEEKEGGQRVEFCRPEHLIDVGVLKWLVMRLCKDEMRYTIG